MVVSSNVAGEIGPTLFKVGPKERRKLREDLLYDAGRFNASKFLIKTLILVREASVLNAKQVEKRGLQIADMHWIFHDVVAEIVGFPVGDAAFDASAGQPKTEAARVVIAAIAGGSKLPLRIDGAAKFAAKND